LFLRITGIIFVKGFPKMKILECGCWRAEYRFYEPLIEENVNIDQDRRGSERWQISSYLPMKILMVRTGRARGTIG
jgi:hypothetical protein